MINENTLEHFRQKSLEKVAELEPNQKLLKQQLSQRSIKAPQARDIFVFKHPDTLGIQWVVLGFDEQNPQHLLIVPADDTPMVGSMDVELPKSALCSPLTLRCGYSLSIDKKQFDMNLRVGILEERHQQRALDKLKQISDNNVRSSLLQQETDDDLDYEQWMEQVYQAQEALRIMPPPAPQLSKYEKIVSGISNIYQRLKSLVFLPRKKRLVWTGGVMATFFMFLIVWQFYLPVPEQLAIDKQLNKSYQFVLTQPLVKLTVPTQKDYPLIESSSQKTPQAFQAFEAGVQAGKQALTSSSVSTLDKKWQQSEWKTFFELGRWTLLLNTIAVSNFQHEVSKTFWKEQKQIFDALQMALEAQQDTYLEMTRLKNVFSEIEQLLNRLPNENQQALYPALIKQLQYIGRMLKL